MFKQIEPPLDPDWSCLFKGYKCMSLFNNNKKKNFMNLGGISSNLNAIQLLRISKKENKSSYC